MSQNDYLGVYKATEEIIEPGRLWERHSHLLHVHEFEQASGAGDGQESLACCNPRGHKESDMTEQQQQKEA